MKLEINHRKGNEKNKKDYMENKQHDTKKPNRLMMKSKRKLKNTLRHMTMRTQPQKIYGMQKRSSQREVQRDIDLPQKTRKISNKQPNLLPKRIRRRRTKKPKCSRRKEIIKIREEINKIEIKRTMEITNNTKSWFLKG